jgi:hypothetical protein
VEFNPNKWLRKVKFNLLDKQKLFVSLLIHRKWRRMKNVFIVEVKHKFMSFGEDHIDLSNNKYVDVINQ